MEIRLHFIYIIIYAQTFTNASSQRLNYSLSPRMKSSARDVEEVQRFLKQLLNETLKGQHVFLFYDDTLDDEFGFINKVLKEIGLEASIYISTIKRFCFTCYDGAFFRQGFIINLFLFNSDIEDFLNSLNENVPSWGPSYIIAISLNSSLGTSYLISNPTIQRSNYLFLAELTHNSVSSTIIETFTVKPYFNNETNAQELKLPLGIWNSNRQMEDIFPERFNNFGGAVLGLGSWCDDFPYLYDSHFNDSEICVGSNLDTLTIIGEDLNFTYETQYKPVDMLWGSFEDGNWTGMLADIKFRGKDLTVNSFPIDEDKMADFDFAYPYHVEGYGFMSMLPAPLPKWRGLLYPFATEVWISIILSGVGGVIFTIVILKISPTNEIREDFSYIILLMLAPFFNQCLDMQLRSLYLKIWISAWLLVTLIVTTAYTSNLVSFLSIQVYPYQINTVEEIASAKTRVLMSNYGSFVPDALKTSQDKTLAAMGKKLDLIDLDGDAYGPAMEDLKTRKHILIETTAYMINVRRRFNMTDLTYILKAQVYVGNLAYYFPKNSPLQKPMGQILMHLIEAGISDKLFNDHMEPALKSTNQNTESGDDSSALEISNLLGCFFLLIVGLAMGTVIFLVEILVDRNRRRRERRSKLKFLSPNVARNIPPVNFQKPQMYYYQRYSDYYTIY